MTAKTTSKDKMSTQIPMVTESSTTSTSAVGRSTTSAKTKRNSESQTISVILGRALTLSCPTVHGYDDVLYVWRDKSGEIKEFSPNLAVDIRKLSDYGEYICTASYGKNHKQSIEKKINIIRQLNGHEPYSTTLKSTDDTDKGSGSGTPEEDLGYEYLEEKNKEALYIYLNETLAIKCTRFQERRESMVFQWSHNNTAIPRARINEEISLSTYIIRQATAKDAGYYKCKSNLRTRHLNVIFVSQSAITGGPKTIKISIREKPKVLQFHCSVNFDTLTAKDLLWKFIRFTSSGYKEVKNMTKSIRVSDAGTTSYLDIKLEHENAGTYICYLDEPRLRRKHKAEMHLYITGCRENFFECMRYKGIDPKIKCIPAEKTCDKKDDCGNGYDENEKCKKCQPDEIKCETTIHRGRGSVPPTAYCVKKSRTCDGIDDCGNEYDEFDCRKCKPPYVQCQGYPRMSVHKPCIRREQLCDRVDDCGNRWDEREEICRCKSDESKCMTIGGRLPRKWCYKIKSKCDGRDDCGNSWDERNCSPPDIDLIINPANVVTACARDKSVSAVCGERHSKVLPSWREPGRESLDSRISISTLIRNDKYIRLTLKQPNVRDDGRVFECYYRNAIKRVTLRVNTTCQNCECEPNEVKCRYKRKDQRRREKACIPRLWLCDGEDDCGNNWDEHPSQCSNATCLRQNKIGCSNGEKTIPRGFWCDGEGDCDDNSDETSCGKLTVIFPTSVVRMERYCGSKVVLNCSVSGIPPPVISWRHNWNCLPRGMTVTESCAPSNISLQRIKQKSETITVTSYLTIPRLERYMLGYYTCEANSGKNRAFASDYVLREKKRPES